MVYLVKAVNKDHVLWNVFQLYQNDKPVKGMLKKQMLLPPFQKPPFAQKNMKNSNSEITLEIL
jgi:hypothetical protein